jgi:hypothetical protein
MAAQGVTSNDVEVCPVGKMSGQRWDSFETPVLQQALNGTSPYITTEMKDYIRSVLVNRENKTKANDAEVVVPEVTHV